MKIFYLLSMIFITGCASMVYDSKDFENLYGPVVPKQRVVSKNESRQQSVSFLKDVKPILDSRCVACHGCYDAPCQLKMGSIEGIDRGANKKKVYDFARLHPADPTRLFIDAAGTEDWRKKEFFPVLNERNDTKLANLDNSVMAQLLQLKRQHPLPTIGKLNKDYDFEFDRSLQCPTIDEFPKYKQQHPQWGMPYAMPGLSLKEENTLLRWLQEGAKVEPLPPLPKRTTAQVNKWEQYFNGTTTKQKLVSRYIYEHLFIGHLHFKGHSNQEFFRLMRSTTPPGQSIQEINSIRPYDDPGTQTFYYRLRPVTETIVDKIHLVYELSDQKMQRYNALFFKPDYSVTTLPSYESKIAANPFKVFAELPLASRYKFLLDDAQYFISGFTKGPVCRGEVATESIRDRFWVTFVEPNQFHPTEVAKALAENNEILVLPGEEADSIGLFGWAKYDESGRQYLKQKDDFINARLPKGRGFGLKNIWDGEGQNPNAALTVFRHLNSATVEQGFIGDVPITGWVVDYPIFERLHYLLVAGFNVFGTAGHQLASRTYMDILRQDGEDNFLRFMPAKERKSIHDSWYIGPDGIRIADPLFSVDHETEIHYQTPDSKKEFFDQVRQRLGKAAGIKDSINYCESPSCTREHISSVQQQVDGQIRELAKLNGLDIQALPEVSLLRVKMGNADTDLVYTILNNRVYSNLSKLVSISSRRIPEKDTLTIVPGFIGSYPNIFFQVDKSQVGQFTDSLRHAKDETAVDQFYSRYGIRRSNPDIWQHVNWFNQQHVKYRGLQAGLLDMSRYENL